MVFQGAEEQVEDLIGIQTGQGTMLQHQGRGGAETDAARQRVEEVPPPAGTQAAGSAWEGPPRRDLAQEAFNVTAPSASSPFTPRAGRADMWPASLSARGGGAPLEQIKAPSRRNKRLG
jgi:hypothetical protein